MNAKDTQQIFEDFSTYLNTGEATVEYANGFIDGALAVLEAVNNDGKR